MRMWLLSALRKMTLEAIWKTELLPSSKGLLDPKYYAE